MRFVRVPKGTGWTAFFLGAIILGWGGAITILIYHYSR